MLINEQIFGIYKAIVTDVSCFEQTGKIKTRISVFNNGASPSDLINGYDSDEFAHVISRDMLTDIMLPFGGGYDYGMFKLPPVNSVGLVAFIDAAQTSPVWLGATANSIRNSDNRVVQLDFPSDRDNNKPAIYYDDSNETPVFNFDDPNSFIIKTKTNELNDYTTPETMVWSNNPVENSFVLNSSKARLYHRIDDDTYQEFVLDSGDEKNSGSISMTYTVSEEEYKKVSVDDDSVLIRNKNGNITAQIILDDEGGVLINSFEEGAGNNITGSTIDASIKITPASIALVAGHSKISMNRNINENNEKITISANNLQIDARNVSFGSSGYSFVVSPNSNLAFTLEDGSMLTTANNIRT